MGKRYKKGNKGKSRKKSRVKQFKERELRINKLINKFRRIVLKEDIMNERVYIKCNRLRLKIKELLNIQSKQLYSQSRKRRYVYYDQVMTFKGIYVYWKKETLPVFLKVKYDFPEHIIPILSNFYISVKKGCSYSYNIFH